MYLCRNDRFLAIYVNVSCHKCTTSDRRWQWSCQLGVCFQKKTCDNPLWKSTEVRPFDFVMWIAPPGEIHVMSNEILYICRKWSRIMISANLIWSFLILDMKFYGVNKGIYTYMRSICSQDVLNKWLKSDLCWKWSRN